MNTPIDTNDRPQWWHKLNAASPEIAERAWAHTVEQRGGEITAFGKSFLWSKTPEGRATDGKFWADVYFWLDGTKPQLPAIPKRN